MNTLNMNNSPYYAKYKLDQIKRSASSSKWFQGCVSVAPYEVNSPNLSSHSPTEPVNANITD